MDALLVIVLLAALVYSWYRGHTRLRGKGYGRAAITTLFAVLLFICLAIGGSVPDHELGPPASLAVWSGVALLLAWSLPDRKGARTAGRRRAWQATASGWVFVAGGGAMTLFFVWQLIWPTIVPRDQGWPGLVVALGVLAGSERWFTIARRSQEAPETLPALADSVLYLRAFDEENLPFAVGPRSALKSYTTQYAAHPVISTKGDPTLELTLEDYLEEEITTRIGPFVGLGNPYDKAAPDGATREYATDEQWQARFLELAGTARCIVVSIGDSANLEWELARIQERGLGQKLCLFTPPIVPGANATLLSRVRQTAAAPMEALAAAWTQAASVLRRVGFACGDNPGPGAALTFDEHGNGTILTADATTPAEFIAPVADWFKEGKASGRCVPVACSGCGTPTFTTTAGAAGGSLCRDCRRKDERARQSFMDRHPTIAGTLLLASFLVFGVFCRLVLNVQSFWIIAPLYAVVALAVIVLWHRVSRSVTPRS